MKVRILERWFSSIDVSKELFWTDRSQGGWLYHFFNIGLYKLPIENIQVSALSITIPFMTI
ncbi:TPA: hypothetical protein KD866_002572 [Vibrio parahaemolyticus]|nr:hypothetical protein [Vibrio parahaemolyticus]